MTRKETAWWWAARLSELVVAIGIWAAGSTHGFGPESVLVSLGYLIVSLHIADLARDLKYIRARIERDPSSGDAEPG